MVKSHHSYISKGRIRSYSFGFNGKEKVNEVYGEGNAYDFGARIHDPRIGRWQAIDPMAMKYPQLSPYCYVNNCPILYTDPDGRDIVIGISATEPYTSWADGTLYSGHCNIYVTKYEQVIVKSIVQGKEVSQTYYKAVGFYEIENWPIVTESCTFVTEHGSDEAQLDRNNLLKRDNTAVYQIEKDKGISVNSTNFDLTLNPNLKPNQTLFTFDEIKNEQAILNEANCRAQIPTPPYSGTGIRPNNPNYYNPIPNSYLNQNDCSSLPVQMLILIGKIEPGTDFGIFSYTNDKGKEFNLYMPNEIGKDLQNLGFPTYIMDEADYKTNMTDQSTKTYLQKKTDGK
jgi:RHS repeat-associated protein